jgi:hypothetical protein
MITNNNISININTDDSNTNDFLYCYSKFGSIPNRLVLHQSIPYDIFLDELTEIESENSLTEVILDQGGVLVNDRILSRINVDIYLSYVILDKDSDDAMVVDLVFFYKDKSDFDKISSLVELFIDKDQDLDDVESNESIKSNLNIIAIKNGSLYISSLTNNKLDNENIELYYNEDTFKSIRKSIKNIKKNSKGISIFHGERGLGKTNIINYLSTMVDRPIIFIPNNLIEHTINNPEFKNILSHYTNPVLVLDDCEMIFNEIYARTNSITNNLLQMVDGIDSDQFMVNFLLIFNEIDGDEIDGDLIDSNNILDIVDFKLLTIDESNQLSKHLGQKLKYKNDTKLINVIRKQNKKSTNSALGF